MGAVKQRWKPWVPVGIWLVILVIESSDIGSSDHTGKLFLKVWTILLGAPTNPQTFELVHHLIRKTGHFMGYAILSLLIFRALRGAWRNRQEVLARSLEYFWQLRWSLLALFGTLLAASADEIHQTFNPDRTGRWQDVVLDCTGALVMQVLLYLWITSRKRGSRVQAAEVKA